MEESAWTANQLMGVETEEAPHTVRKKGKKVVGKGVDEDPMLWGVPGHLTQTETEVYFKFKDTVDERGGAFRDTVYSFGDIEGEVWALCRWLRARKFVYDDVITMVEEATKVRKDAKLKNFYPDPVEALGVDSALYFTQYPQLYPCETKKGVPVFISKPGILNVDGMECITTLDGILKFHWHIMMHDFAQRLQEQKKKNPANFKKFECFCVLDLDHLTTNQLSRRALAITKEQAAIDSICFPETMAKMLIVNSPTFFSATWRLIKGWLDPRTASKIEVISSRSTMEKRLLEFIDEDQLPSDYGGKGTDTNTILNSNVGGGFKRLESKMLYLRGHGSETIDVQPDETLVVKVYTRSKVGATFSVVDENSTMTFVDNMEVAHTGGEDAETALPTNVLLNEQAIPGPTRLKIKAVSKASRFSTHNYLLVFCLRQK